MNMVSHAIETGWRVRKRTCRTENEIQCAYCAKKELRKRVCHESFVFSAMHASAVDTCPGDSLRRLLQSFRTFSARQ